MSLHPPSTGISKRLREGGLHNGADRYEAQADSAQAHVGLLRGMLSSPGEEA